MIQEITVTQLKSWLQEKQDIVILDVRQDWERESESIPNDIHIPLHSLPDTELTIQPNQKLVIYCHLGQRSAYAAQYLQDQGFKEVYSLKGGIVAFMQDS